MLKLYVKDKMYAVEMSDLKIIDHDTAAVVTCKSRYEGPQWTGELKFMRVWLKENGRWRIIAISISN